METRPSTNLPPELQETLPVVLSECAIWTGNSGSCSSDAAIKVMIEEFSIADAFVNNGKDDKVNDYVINKAKKITNCNTERCVLDKIKHKINYSKEIARLKLEGPGDNTLLSNVNIDDTLQSWRNKYQHFFPYNFNMVDYKTYSFRNGRVQNSPDTLHTISMDDLIKRNITQAACVINTDHYHGTGKHWMALFVDITGGTVEFFNSSGNNPQPAWVDWMVKTKSQLEALDRPCKLIKVSTIRHQNSKTECGVYSLYYIWCRLNGISYDVFLTKKISDDHIFHFRQHLFADPNVNLKKWNWAEYQKVVGGLKWE